MGVGVGVGVGGWVGQQHMRPDHLLGSALESVALTLTLASLVRPQPTRNHFLPTRSTLDLPVLALLLNVNLEQGGVEK